MYALTVVFTSHSCVVPFMPRHVQWAPACWELHVIRVHTWHPTSCVRAAGRQLDASLVYGQPSALVPRSFGFLSDYIVYLPLTRPLLGRAQAYRNVYILDDTLGGPLQLFASRCQYAKTPHQPKWWMNAKQLARKRARSSAVAIVIAAQPLPALPQQSARAAVAHSNGDGKEDWIVMT
jgi:hypothetical protein